MIGIVVNFDKYISTKFSLSWFLIPLSYRFAAIFQLNSVSVSLGSYLQVAQKVDEMKTPGGGIRRKKSRFADLIMRKMQI